MSGVNNIGDKYTVIDGWGHAFPVGSEVTLVETTGWGLVGGSFKNKDVPFHQCLRWSQVKKIDDIIEENE